jgi:hypothetical protein
MARRLSVRRRGDGYFEVGPASHGPTITVGARDRRDALRQGKEALRKRGHFEDAVARSFRFQPEGIDTRPRVAESDAVGSR